MAATLSTSSTPGNRLVERASSSTVGKFVGIITTKDANLVTLTSPTADVVVTTSGEVSGFVTDINGQVHKGDYLTVSPLKGILMRATNKSDVTVGISLEDFNNQPTSIQ